MVKLTSLKELKEQRRALVNTNEKLEESLSIADKIALWITDRVGSMKFFAGVFIWTIVWLGWNLAAPEHLKFDPSPGFVFWLFISNVIQIFLMPLIMIAQNVQARQAYLRAVHDLEINIKAEQEIEVILEHLEFQNKTLEYHSQLTLNILKKIEKNQTEA